MAVTTYHSLLANRPSAMGPFVVLSVVGHATIVVVLLVLQWLYEKPKIDLDQKPIMASIVRQGKKRDEQLLPRKDEAPPPEPEKVPIPTPGVKPEPVTKKPEKHDKTESTKKSLFDALNKTAKAEDPEGDENGDPNGDAAKQEGERYYGIIKAAVRRYYDVSSTIPESERIQLKADVVIKLDSDGRLLDLAFARESMNDLFNNAILAAIKKAQPFGPPPAALRGPLKKDGVQLRFTP